MPLKTNNIVVNESNRMTLIKLQFTFLSFLLHSFLFCQTPIAGNGIMDIDGNNYNSVIYPNGQEWMTENLKTGRFSNGDEITYSEQSLDWQTLNAAAYSYYNHDESSKNIFGNLYNWFTTIDERNVCPSGWHVPTDNEWTALTDVYGGNGVAGGKMKVEDTLLWQAPNLGATNESLFSALPAGCRYDGGNFSNIEKYSYWWTSTQLDNQFCWYRSAFYNSDNLVKNYTTKTTGFSIRCVKNQLASNDSKINNLELEIFPNPFTDIVTINSSNEIQNLTLTDSRGKIIKTFSLQSENHQLSLQSLESGVYFIVNPKTLSTYRLIKL